jgi:adhesin/invasin
MAGTPTPLTFLTNTVNTLTATIGGASAFVNFAGLTPGYTGLYQVNVVVPNGLPDSDTTTLILTISGQDSAQVTLAVHK